MSYNVWYCLPGSVYYNNCLKKKKQINNSMWHTGHLIYLYCFLTFINVKIRTSELPALYLLMEGEDTSKVSVHDGHVHFIQNHMQVVPIVK